MTQNEFENITGQKVTANEYAYIERVYMASNLQKDEFCKEWNKNHTLATSNLVCDLMMEIESLRRQIKANHDALEGAVKLQDVLAYFIADMAHRAFNAECNGAELRRKAVEVLGKREYLKYIISKGYELEQFDREDLTKILSAA